MGFKNWILPLQTDLPILDKAKSFVGTPEGEIFQNTAAKLLQKFGFVGTELLGGIQFADDIPIGISPFGTLVFDSLIVPAGRYTVINTEGVTEIVAYEGIEIQTIVFEASQQKNIVKTQISGRDGSIKEYISSNDTAITMRGAVVNSLNIAYPRVAVQRLIRILKVPQQIRVVSKFINDTLGFEFITIESWNLITTPGMRNVQAFTITAVNDVSPEADEKYG
jgi:hypothetical protein